MSSNEQIPQGDSMDNDYVSRTGQKQYIPVQKDDAPVDDPYNNDMADSDEQLRMSSP